MTFGAALGVGENPIGRFRFVAALFVPKFQVFAIGGRMGFLAAHQTKRARAGIAVRHAAFRFHGGRREGGGHALATGAGAPSRERIAFDKGTQLERSVLL